MSSFNKKSVKFDDCVAVWDYEYDRTMEDEDKKGRDWIRTTDLTCREFRLTIEKGGCGGDWNILQRKLDELEEPYWCLIGQLWQRLFPGEKRLEEDDSSEEEEKEEEPEHIISKNHTGL